tara:strand:+ start:1381 stop:2124 length:744 start_codon:yes stop_codon:yes gene_type:complete
MAFRTDGSVHYSGIKNEGKTADILNKKNIYGCKVETRGGTKYKEDLIAGLLKLSAKDKKRLSLGSFDWINTSKVVPSIFGDYFDSFKEEVSKIREMNVDDRVPYLSSIRTKFADICSIGFDYLSKEQVCDLIVDSISHGIDEVIVNDKENSVLYRFNPEQHPAVHIAQNCDAVRLTGRGKGSRKVIFIKDGVEYDYGMRLRITCNNGISAFLGLSKANRNSQVVIKVQQDSVHKLVKEWVDCTTISY